MKNIKTAKWLKENINSEGIIILDSRSELGNSEYGLDEYKKGHIPRAIFVSVEDVLTGDVNIHGGRHPLPNMDQFITNMEELGVDDSSTVIVYDDGDLAMAGRLWWMLKYIGKQQVYLLQGGFNQWKSLGYGFETKDHALKAKGNLSKNLQDDLIVTIEEVKEKLYREDTIVVDSRTPDRFRGEIEPIDKIPGHIPNSKNYPWTILTQENSTRDITFLKDHFKGLDKYEDIIVHCGSGITGTVNCMFMEEIGLKPRLYVGGYSDWISYDDNEIVIEV